MGISIDSAPPIPWKPKSCREHSEIELATDQFTQNPEDIVIRILIGLMQTRVSDSAP
jgi:hypothetical protein